MFAICAYNVKVLPQFNNSYFSKEQCNSLKAICALVVVLHHISHEIVTNSFLDSFSDVGYLATSVFFFISSYGHFGSLFYGNVLTHHIRGPSAGCRWRSVLRSFCRALRSAYGTMGNFQPVHVLRSAYRMNFSLSAAAAGSNTLPRIRSDPSDRPDAAPPAPAHNFPVCGTGSAHAAAPFDADSSPHKPAASSAGQVRCNTCTSTPSPGSDKSPAPAPAYSGDRAGSRQAPRPPSSCSPDGTT